MTIRCFSNCLIRLEKNYFHCDVAIVVFTVMIVFAAIVVVVVVIWHCE